MAFIHCIGVGFWRHELVLVILSCCVFFAFLFGLVLLLFCAKTKIANEFSLKGVRLLCYSTFLSIYESNDDLIQIAVKFKTVYHASIQIVQKI